MNQSDWWASFTAIAKFQNRGDCPAPLDVLIPGDPDMESLLELDESLRSDFFIDQKCLAIEWENNKMPVTTIERLDLPSGRVYRTPVGDLPSVSHIMQTTMSEADQVSLAKWRNRVGEETANAIRDAACARGTVIHQLAECQIRNGKIPEVPEELRNYWLAIVEELPDRDSTFMANHSVYGGDQLAIELPVYHSELRYGGTLDWAGYWRGDNTLWLLDFKTSEKAKTQQHVLQHSIQLAAYAMALENIMDITIDRAGVLIGRPFGSGQKFLFDENQMRLARTLWKNRLEQYHAQ
jgi:hypothetical protein